MVPLYGFLEGDTIGLLVLAQPDDTIAEVRRKLESAASVRVPPAPGRRVLFAGRELDETLTVADVGLTALERIDVVNA